MEVSRSLLDRIYSTTIRSPQKISSSPDERSLPQKDPVHQYIRHLEDSPKFAPTSASSPQSPNPNFDKIRFNRNIKELKYKK